MPTSVGRRLLNLLTALSLLLCVAVVALWVRSYWRGDFVSYSRPSPTGGPTPVTGIIIATGLGNVWVSWQRWQESPPHGWNRGSGEPVDVTERLTPNHALGFGYDFSYRPPPGREFLPGEDSVISVAFPLWLPTLLASVLPAARLRRRLVRHRAGTHRCFRCGYDLRATPERCPECGTLAGLKVSA